MRKALRYLQEQNIYVFREKPIPLYAAIAIIILLNAQQFVTHSINTDVALRFCFKIKQVFSWLS